MTELPVKKCEDRVELLKLRRGYSLKGKIHLTNQRITEWYEHFEGKVYVAFSGGKDSTVLLHLVRELYPEVPAVFCDTGLEYPEIKDFVRTMDNVTWLRPKLSFTETIAKYGYPVVSKRISQYVHEIQVTKSAHMRQLRLTGLRKNGTYSPMAKISQKWQYLINAPFKVTEKCCKIFKKDPSIAYGKKTGRVPYIGTMAGEGKQRELGYIQHGCNAYTLTSQPRSAPLSFWMEDDIWEYIHTKNLPYSEIYKMGYDRTGCMFCMFGVHMEKGENRFQKMKRTHPKLWKYCITKLGLGEVLKYMKIPYEDAPPGYEQTDLFSS